ncbi:MAG: SDR family oxidoreductase [Flavobacteriales bacterium]|nr:SDR family oxidoreductase [Flavobacteriales bacterium]
MAEPLEGKTALVTGAGLGIGHAICTALAQAGASVIAVARNRSNLERLASSLNDVRHRFWSIDLATEVGRADLLKHLHEGELPVIVVNNLHIPSPKGRLRNVGAEAFSNGFTANIDHLLTIMDPVLAAQQANGFGRWIGITSKAAQTGMPGQGRYNAQKAALEALFRTLAVEEGGKGITANCVAPGFIDTPSVAERLPAEVRQRVSRSNATGRAGTPEEVAAAVLFLASPASGFITGEVLSVDGGASLAWAFK